MRSGPWRLLVATSTLVAACKKSAVAPEDDSLDEVVRTADLELPRSEHVGTLRDAPTKIIVGRKVVMVAGDKYRVTTIPSDPALGFTADDKRNGRSDLFVTPLGHALHGAHLADGGAPITDAAPSAEDSDPTDVVIVADLHTTYRVLVEVISTARQSEFSSPAIAFTCSTGLATLSLSTTKATRGVGVMVMPDGIVVSIGGHHVAPGCKNEGPGISIAKTAAGEYDWDALTACAKRIKDDAAEASDAGAHVGGDGAIELAVVLRAIDALHGDTETGDLFTDVALSTPPPGAP